MEALTRFSNHDKYCFLAIFLKIQINAKKFMMNKISKMYIKTGFDRTRIGLR